MNINAARKSFLAGEESDELSAVEDEISIALAESGADRDCNENELEELRERKLFEMLNIK